MICKHCHKRQQGEYVICTCTSSRAKGLCHVICIECARPDAGAGIAAVNAARTNPLHRDTIKRTMRMVQSAFQAVPRGEA